MKLIDLYQKETELLLRLLTFAGVQVITDLSSWDGRFKLSESDLAEQEVKEIHVLADYEGIRERLSDLGFSFKGKLTKPYRIIFAPKHKVLHDPSFKGTFDMGDEAILNTNYGIAMPGEKGVILLSVSGLFFATDSGVKICESERWMLDNLIYIKKNEIHNKEDKRPS